jgi:apolipoprotein D and lipocalin family protein
MQGETMISMSSRIFRRSVCAGLCAAIAGGAALAAPPQPTKSVDITRYAGRWFEMARLHNRIEEGCIAATADYIDAGDHIQATETCRHTPPSPDKVYRASVKILDPGQNAKLRLTFFPFIYKDYWVLDHAADYSWAILGEPTGKYLWIFTRTPEPAPAERSAVIARAKALGYDVSKLILDEGEFRP